MKKIVIVLVILFIIPTKKSLAQANSATYLNEIKAELVKVWPDNRTINLVFHGHSVPTGYFKTPEVRRTESYPFLLFKALGKKYPSSVVNVITTSIGGENSVQGEKRFKEEVLVHQPDVLFIDYALNDRNIGLDKSKAAMEKMIEAALQQNIKVVLLTPSPDLGEDILLPDNKLAQHARQLIYLAEKYGVALVDSYQVFKRLKASGTNLAEYMAQSNHPNKKGHQLIADEILFLF